MNGKPTVAAIVLNWNGYEETATCIRSLEKLDYEPLEIIIVDNGSNDSSAKRLRGEFPNKNHVWSSENRGFAAGNNLGIEAAKEIGASYVWILNNDITIRDDTEIIDVLVDDLQDSGVGIVTPQVKHSDTGEIWFNHGTVNWTCLRRNHDNIDSHTDTIINNNYVPLCSALMSLDIFEKVGLLPERYFLYSEDIDFCTQVIQNGYSIVTDLRVEVYHDESSSSGGSTSVIPSYYDVRNQFELARSYSNKVSFPLFIFRHSMMLLVLVGYRLLRRRPAAAKAAIKGYIDGIRGKTGRGPHP